MQKIIFTFLILVFSGAAFVQAQILIDPSSLKERMNKKDLVIIHVGKEDVYQQEHIPGTQFVKSDAFTFDQDDHVYDLPPIADLKSFVENLGITKNSQIVIYTDASWIPSTTRLLFTLDYLGLGKQVSLLNGGLTAWKAAGGKVTDEIPVITKSTLELLPKKDLVVDKDYVKKSLDKKGVTVVDCRASVYYQGIEVNDMHGGRKGRIPGAKSIPFSSLYQKTNIGSYAFKTADDIKNIFEQQGLKKDDEIILYCHIGMQLTVVYTAAKILDYKNVKVFDGSFHEWGPDKSLAVELD